MADTSNVSIEEFNDEKNYGFQRNFFVLFFRLVERLLF